MLRKPCAECTRKATHRVRLGLKGGQVRAVVLACEQHARKWAEVNWPERVRLYRFRKV